MIKSVVLISLCVVLVCVSASKPHSKSLTSCDEKAIKKDVSEVTSLVAGSVSTVVKNVVEIVPELIFCLWLPDWYMCLESDMQFDIYDSFKDIQKSLEDLFEKLPALLEKLSEDVQACASA